jgi:hypothetical protein
MTARKRRGRPPSIWHGPLGKKFVTAVYVTQYEQGGFMGNRAKAIRSVLRRPEFAPIREKYRDSRYLEKMFLDAAEYWRGLPTYKEVIGKGRRVYWDTK